MSQISLPPHTHSHKVRVHGDIMLVNNELFRATTGERPADFEGGIKVYDTSDKTKPRQIGHYQSLARIASISDGAYAYISSEENGFVGDIVVILDLADPTRPEPIARWWMPGQWAEGGEPRPGRAAATAAITRCAAATGSIRAIGTAAL